MQRQITFTAVNRQAGAGTQGPDGLLFLIQDPLTALQLIGTLSQELQRAVDADHPITVGFTGEAETDAEEEPEGATSAADKF